MNATPTPSLLFDLTGKRALVTGASRGIGQAIAVGLARHGATVVGAARTKEGLAETAEFAAAASGSFESYAVDLSSPEGIEDCVASAVATMGGIDILVNNAGFDDELPIEDTSLELFRKIIDINLQACWLLMKSASPYLKDGGGSVINIASTLGLVATRNDSPYVASKHGLVGLTKAIGLEWGRAGVRVNAICPGFVETAMLPDLEADQAAAAYIRKQVPMNRWSVPEEYVGPSVFLASEASSYMTGTTLVVDGGYSAK